MKSVKEIKQVFEDWQREDIPTDDLIVTMVDALIGVTEHLEARTTGWIEPYAINPEHGERYRREGMIEALKWYNNWSTGRAESTPGCPCMLCRAIDRLENGGEL